MEVLNRAIGARSRLERVGNRRDSEKTDNEGKSFAENVEHIKPPSMVRNEPLTLASLDKR